MYTYELCYVHVSISIRYTRDIINFDFYFFFWSGTELLTSVLGVLIVNAVPIVVGFHSVELKNTAVLTDFENKLTAVETEIWFLCYYSEQQLMYYLFMLSKKTSLYCHRI